MSGGALFTDLYELTMLQAYFDEGLEDEAVFDLFVRTLPSERNFLVACGLDAVLEHLETLAFDGDDLDYLDSLKLFSRPFLDYLGRFRFQGHVRAVPEGTIVFGNEPLIEVVAPLPQAQVIETLVLNQVTFGTLIASKGARAVIAAEGRTLVDFGSRRAHGYDAANKAARALYLAGYDSTSNVLAGHTYGIPVAGTMAHSYIQAHESEMEAFRAFVRSFPETVLLVDTYDTIEGIRAVTRLAGELRDVRLRGVRLDSGDLIELSRQARRLLDEAGLARLGIFASGGLDEYEIAEIAAAGAPITAFGVGTSAVVSSDAPALDSAYKLVEYAGRHTMKLSPSKVTLPGRKQVFRRFENGVMAGDVIALESEESDGEPLLRPVMVDGRRTEAGRETLTEARERASRQLEALPPALRSLTPAATPYRVDVSAGLRSASAHLQEELRRT